MEKGQIIHGCITGVALSAQTGPSSGGGYYVATPNDLALAQTPREDAGDTPHAQATPHVETAGEGGCCQQRLVRPRILSFEPHGSELIMRGYDTDEHGNPKLNKKEVKAAIQYLQYWADDNLINLPRWNVGTEKWEGDSQQDKLP